MIQKTGLASNSETVVEGGTVGAARNLIVARGLPYSATGTTGPIAAALAANSAIFAMRLDPGSTLNAFVERVRIQFTCLVAFTVPLTAGRRLELYRGSGAAAIGGTAIAAAHRKRSSQGASQFDAAEGGDIRVATTGTLTQTGITYEVPPIRATSLVHVGNAGNFLETIWEFAATECAPIQLEPGQVLAIRNPVAMDAAGTWTATVNVDWHEAAAI